MMLSKKVSVILVTCFVAATFAGCDMLNSIGKPAKPAKAVKPVAVENQSASEKITVNKDENLPANIVAKVGDWTISTAEFDAKLEAIKKVVADFDEKNIDTQKMVLDELIRQQLLVQEAKSQKLDQTKDVAEAVNDFQNTLLVQELVGRMTENLKVTEAEAREYYDKNSDVFIKPIEKQLREIVVPTETEAKDILVQILQGADFAQTAKDRSKGKSVEKSGDLGFLPQAPFEQMHKALASLNKGGVSSVFEGPEGYYIVKIEDERGGDKAIFEDIKEDLIKGMTVQKQQQTVLDKINEVSKRINVKVNPNLLDKTGE